MRGKAKSSESSTVPSKPRPRVSLEAPAKSMWSCPSMCSKASHVSHPSNAIGGNLQDAVTARKEALAGIKGFKELMSNTKPIPGVVIEPFNIKVIPPCKDCRYIGYNLDNMVALSGCDTDNHTLQQKRNGDEENKTEFVGAELSEKVDSNSKL
ncbi:hypothetical protein REPUB_Repub02eG0196200 [Reevesia pubescens]